MLHDIKCDWWKRIDSPQVFTIERLNNGAQAESEEYFLSLLRERSVVAVVAKLDTVVLGYCVYELGGNGIDIIHLETHPSYAQYEVEAELLDYVVRKATIKGRKHVTMMVRESKLLLQQQLRRIGGKCEGFRKKFFVSFNEDGYYFKINVEKTCFPSLENELLSLSSEE